MKTASLYFDDVLPLSTVPCPANIRSPELDSTVVSFLTDLGLSFTYDIFGEYPTMKLWEDKKETNGKYSGFFESEASFLDFYLSNSAGFRAGLNEYMRKSGFRDTPILIPGDSLITNNPIMENTQDILIELINVPAVNTENAQWNQIFEFRSDTESVAKLRRLRLYLHQTYAGKSKDFLIDHFYSSLEDYNSAARKHGFDLKTGVLSGLINSKSLLATSGATFSSVLFGEPILASVTAAGGALLEVGKISLELSKAKFSSEEFTNQHPLTYIIEANNKLSP
ncbi:hypothetical protein [Marinobacterium halophilum]|nr:hypothetical protein [Marinobacterium halophilum]